MITKENFYLLLVTFLGALGLIVEKFKKTIKKENTIY